MKNMIAFYELRIANIKEQINVLQKSDNSDGRLFAITYLRGQVTAFRSVINDMTETLSTIEK